MEPDLTEEPEQPPGATKSQRIPVHIFNMSEDVWPFIAAMANETTRLFEIRENAALCDREMMGFHAEHLGNGVFVSPQSVEPVFSDYVRSIFGGDRVRVLTTPNHSGLINTDILNSKILLQQLSRLTRIELSSYCPSPQLYKLIDTFQHTHVAVETPELPSKKSWGVVSEYGTKTGFRTLIGSMPKMEMAPGAIYETIDEAIEDAAHRTQGVVLKTKKGHAGVGVALFHPDILGETVKIRKAQIRTKLAEANGFWDQFPVVVEDYIDTDPAVGGGFPNVEGFVTETGKVEIRYHCGMRFSEQGIFAGVEENYQVLTHDVIEKLAWYGNTVGKVYANAGYRGYFDIDFLAASDGRLLASESNIRRNGGTYTYHVMKRLFGKTFFITHWIVTQFLSLPNLRFEEVLDTLDPILYKPGKEEGVILASANVLAMNKLAYMVVGESRDQVVQIEKDMFRKLAQ